MVVAPVRGKFPRAALLPIALSHLHRSVRDILEENLPEAFSRSRTNCFLASLILGTYSV
jgi:hypothetical protein